MPVIRAVLVTAKPPLFISWLALGVVLPVIRVGHQFQILHPVIRWVPVLVMDELVPRQLTAQTLFHHRSVDIHIVLEPNVSIWAAPGTATPTVVVGPSVVLPVALLAAEGSGYIVTELLQPAVRLASAVECTIALRADLVRNLYSCWQVYSMM
jgi:hypothetical protein